MDQEEMLKMIISKLSALIFELEGLKINEKKFTIEIKDDKGKVIKVIHT